MSTSADLVDGPRYGYTVRLHGVSYASAKEAVVAALKAEGFGVLTEIDVRETLKKKLGQDFRPYVILGACNPQLAHQGLEAEIGLGLLLPCNVCVWQDDEASVVSVLRPTLMLEVAQNPALGPIAQEADERLLRALERLKQDRQRAVYASAHD